MPVYDLPSSAIVALRRLIEDDIMPGILDAQLLSAAGLMTQQQPGPLRATDLGREVLESLSSA